MKIVIDLGGIAYFRYNNCINMLIKYREIIILQHVCEPGDLNSLEILFPIGLESPSLIPPSDI